MIWQASIISKTLYIHSQWLLSSSIMEHLTVKKLLIEEVVSFGDDSEFCIHSKLVNELHGINSSEDSEYDQVSSSNSNTDVDQDTQQIESISK